MNKLRRLLFVIPLLGLVSTALADCEKGSKVVFSCSTSKNKIIEVCDAGKSISYSYGVQSKKPEIVVSAPRAQASTTQFSGFGKTMNHSVEVPNGNTTYSVFYSLPLSSKKDAEPEQAGVRVIINKKDVAKMMCDFRKPFVEHIENIKLSATQ